MAYVDAEIASQPDCWRRGGRAGRRRTRRPAAPRASGSPSSAAARRGSWRRRTRRCARRPATARPTRSRRPSSPPAAATTGCRDHPLRHHHRGAGAARRAARTDARPPSSSATRRPRRSSWPPPRSPCAFADEQSVVQTRFATTALALLRAHLGETRRPRSPPTPRSRVRAPLPIDPATHRAVHLPRLRLDGRAGPRGRAEVPRGGQLSGPRRTRRWSTGTARSRSPGRAGWSGRSASCPTGWPRTWPTGALRAQPHHGCARCWAAGRRPTPVDPMADLDPAPSGSRSRWPPAGASTRTRPAT